MFKFIGKYSGTDEELEGTLVLPMRCAVCESEDAELFTYEQGRFPIVLPFVSIHRSTTVTIPYCNRHLEEFHSRFRNLSYLQYGIIALGFPLLFWGGWTMDEEHGGTGGWNWQFAAGLICFCILLPASLFARGYLYDVF